MIDFNRTSARAAVACLAAAGLTGCASHVKGSWACALEPGVVCGSISDIDRGDPEAKAARPAQDPVIEGAIAARLWGQGGWTAGASSGAPLREPDPVLKVSFAPWIDAEGDYHAGAEVFAVMRHGGWFITPRAEPPRVDLSRLSKDEPTAPDQKPSSAGDGGSGAVKAAPRGAPAPHQAPAPEGAGR